MRYEAAVLAATTGLIGLTYLVVVDYAGVEPVANFTLRDAYVFIGAPAALVASWVFLAGVGVFLGTRCSIPRWLSAVLCVFALVAVVFCVSAARGYAQTIASNPRYSCACPR